MCTTFAQKQQAKSVPPKYTHAEVTCGSVHWQQLDVNALDCYSRAPAEHQSHAKQNHCYTLRYSAHPTAQKRPACQGSTMRLLCAHSFSFATMHTLQHKERVHTPSQSENTIATRRHRVATCKWRLDVFRDTYRCCMHSMQHPRHCKPQAVSGQDRDP